MFLMLNNEIGLQKRTSTCVMLTATTHERELLRQQVNELRQREEAAAERYHDSIKTMTRLLEDKREPQKRKKFLGIF